jgi:hypothetical protein
MTLGAGVAAGAIGTLPVERALAVLKLDVTQGNVQPVPIAIPEFIAVATQDPALGRNISQIIGANLQRSGLFAPIDPAAFIEKFTTIDTLPRFPDWRLINAQALVTGRVTQGEGRLKAEFRLWDVFAGQQLHGQQYTTTADNWRRIAHIISDAIYERLTGDKGYFDSRVVFVDESGPKERRIKRLALMDQDGANVRYLILGRYHHLHVLWSGGPSGLLDEHRDRAAGDCQQFSRYDFQPAVFARQPARHLQPAARRQFKPFRHGFAIKGDNAPDRYAGDRHRTILFAGWIAYLFRV